MLKTYSSPLKFLFVFLFNLAALGLFSQNTATVFGKITDKDSQPIEDVTISILGSSAAPTTTNSKGEYRYDVPANTEITLVFNNLSYEQININLNLTAGETKEINKRLTLQQAIIPEVIVTDNNRFKSLTRIDPINVVNIPTASQDFNAILFTLPGVSSRNELSSSYSVRGGNFDENLVYVNGIEVYRPFLTRSGQQEGLSFINPNMVSSIVFSAGGFEAKYGDKMSSVLDVQYRRPRKFAGTVSASMLGSSLHLEGASKNYRFTWLVGARYKTNKYLLSQTDSKGDYHPFFSDLQLYTTYDLTTNWELDFLGNFATNKYQFIPQTRKTDFGTVNKAYQLNIYFDGQEIDHFNTSMGALSASYKDDAQKLNLKFIGSAFRSHESEAFDIIGVYRISDLETDFGKTNFGDTVSGRGIGGQISHGRTNLEALVLSAEHKGIYSFGKNQLLWGVKYNNEQISDKLNEWNYIDSADYSLPSFTGPVTNPENMTIELQDVVKQKLNISSNRVSGFVEGILTKETKDTSTITATLGMRANYWDFNHQALVGPRGTIALKPNWKKDYVFKFSSGYYYQPPFYRELRNPQGILNKDIKAQTSIHFVLASDHQFKAWNRPFKFTAEAYYKHLDNLIPYVVDNVRIRYSANNNAKGYATGIDFKINGEFIKGLESWASLSLMKTQEDIKDDFYYTYFNSDGDTIVPGYTRNSIKTDSIRTEPGYLYRPTDQRVNFSLFFQDQMPKLPDLKMHLNLLFGTGVPFGPSHGQPYQRTLRMPAYRRIDIGFSYQALKEKRVVKPKGPGRFIKSIWLSMEVFNLLGTNNTVSFLWVEDVTNRQYAVPNYLTHRQLNLRTIVKF